MKKAYDSVSTTQLLKAFKRIHIHLQYIKLIENIQTQQTNKVNTFFGETDGYQVLDGLNQGEVNAPIYWRIFYNPLLVEIKRHRRKFGFEVTSKWKDQTTNQLKTSHN